MEGKFAAYQSQPAVSSGQFEGAGAFSQMAAVTATKRAEEREEQRRLNKEMRDSVGLAVEAGNVDMSKINESIYSLVAARQDAYAEEVTDIMQQMEHGYSFELQTKLNKVRTKFQSDIGTFVGLGNAIKTYSDGYSKQQYDNVLAVEGINGLTRFVQNIPNLVESFDPVNMSVGGKHITSLFNDMVPASAFVAKVDSETDIDDFLQDAMIQEEKTIRLSPTEQTTKQFASFNDKDAKAEFRKRFSDTLSFKREAMKLQREFDGMPEDERMEWIANGYVTENTDGDVTVHVDNLYNYIRDTRMTPLVERTLEVRDRELQQKEPSEADRRRAREFEDNVKKARDIYQAYTSGGSVGLSGQGISLYGLKGNIQSDGTRRMYDPFTGQMGAGITMSRVDNKGVSSRYTQVYSMDDMGAQAFSKAVYGTGFDLEAVRGEATNRGVKLDFIPEPTSFEQRKEDIDLHLATQEQLLVDRLRIGGAGSVLSEGLTNAFNYASQVFPEQSGEITPLTRFFAEVLPFTGRTKPPIRGSFAEYGYKVTKPIPSDQASVENSAPMLARAVAVARAMKAEGHSDKEIAKELKDVYNGESTYNLDRVSRNAVKPEQREYAQQLLEEGLSDDDIISTINGSHKISKAMKAYSEANNVSIVESIRAFARVNGISVFEVYMMAKRGEI